MSLKRVLIMTGGTGGHVFPGLAIAEYLRAQGVEVHWMGTEKGIEARVVPKAAIPLHNIQITGLRGKGIAALLKSPYRLTQAIYQARQIIKKVNPDVALGLGGFVSGPGGIASRLMGIPLIIHEQNAKAGLTNRFLAHLSKEVLEGFPNVFKKATYIGNPIRKEIIEINAPRFRVNTEARLRLLVLGGSLGAKALNETVPQALAQLPSDARPHIWHQSGEQNFQATQNTYVKQQIEAKVMPFIDNMAEAYAWADLVICRAGALTVSELAAVGLGAIFIPYPYAVDDHQTANAQFLVSRQAALCIQQADLTPDVLLNHLQFYVKNPYKCLEMAEAAYHLRKIDAVEKFFAIIAGAVRANSAKRRSF